MTITELLQRNDQEQAAGEIGFAEWHTIKDALNLLREGREDFGELETGYTEAEENCKGCMGPCGMCVAAEMEVKDWKELAKGMESQLIAAQERIEQLEFEREEVRKMRTAQKAFFKSPQGSAARNTALEDSRRLERWVDAALEPEKPTAATLFG